MLIRPPSYSVIPILGVLNKITNVSSSLMVNLYKVPGLFVNIYIYIFFRSLYSHWIGPTFSVEIHGYSHLYRIPRTSISARAGGRTCTGESGDLRNGDGSKPTLDGKQICTTNRMVENWLNHLSTSAHFFYPQYYIPQFRGE